MASSSGTSNMGNVVVVTHVVPSTPSVHQQLPSQQSLRFRKGQPKALGVVMIMIGVVTLTLGFSMTFYHHSLVVFSGIFVWGSLIYISAGSVAVAAETQFNKCLIDASLGLNIVATMVSVSGIILNAMDGIIWNYPYEVYFYPGFSVVQALFHALAFYVSIISAGCTCRATCCMEPQVMVHTVEGVLDTQALTHSYTATAAPAPAPTEAPFNYKSPGPGFDLPPAYQPQL